MITPIWRAEEIIKDKYDIILYKDYNDDFLTEN